MSFFKPLIEQLAQGREFELGTLPNTVITDIDLLVKNVLISLIVGTF